jgi:hypothetical protein
LFFSRRTHSKMFLHQLCHTSGWTATDMRDTVALVDSVVLGIPESPKSMHFANFNHDEPLLPGHKTEAKIGQK